MHQLPRVRVASQFACYSDESLLHQEQDSWPIMYSAGPYRSPQPSPETRACGILLVTSFGAYRSLPTRAWAPMPGHRFPVSGLDRCKPFTRLWPESLHIEIIDALKLLYISLNIFLMFSIMLFHDHNQNQTSLKSKRQTVCTAS